MARILTAGAEEGKGRAFQDQFSVNMAGIAVYDLADNTTVGPRSGDYYYYINGNGAYMQYPIPASSTELYFGFGAFIPPWASGQTNLSLYFTGIDAGIRFDCNSGLIYWVRGSTQVTSTATLPLNRWVYIECYIKPVNSGTGVVTIKINGVQVLTTTGQNITNAFSVFGNIRFNCIQNNSNVSAVYYDDIVVNDTSGTTNLTWPGQVRLFPLRIKGPGDHTDLTRGGADLGYNNSQVREVAGANSWVEGGTTDYYDLYAVDAPDLPAGVTIANIIVDVRARAQSGGKSIKPIIKSNATASDGTAVSLGSAWQSAQAAWALDPQDSAAWTEADLATLQIGAKIA